MRGEALEDALRDMKAEGRLVLAVRETGLMPLMEIDVLASGREGGGPPGLGGAGDGAHAANGDGRAGERT